MSLSKELISQFAKIAKSDTKKTSSESTVFGTIVEYNGSKYMRIDGSELLTPIASTTNVEPDDRVTGVIKNHALIVTGNLTSPSARTEDVEEIGNKISSFEIVIADKVDAKELNVERGRIDKLISDNATIKKELTANSADIKTLKADNVTIQETLTAREADIDDLKAENVEIENKLSAADADIESLQSDNVLIRETLTANEADISDLEADNVQIKETLTAVDADIEALQTDKLSAKAADLKYANIDFTNIGKAAMEYLYSESGLIKDVVVGDGTITGHLVGVTISGDIIEGNTVVADKLVIKGEDGLYYKLNTDGIKTEAEQTDYNSLNGSIIRAKSITATQIKVADLVAFDATIGGFKISPNSIYSGVKEAVDNQTRGIYMDNDGQVALGDASNYIKFYKDTDGQYKLTISASSLSFEGNRTFEEAVADSVDGLEMGGRNLKTNTSSEWFHKSIDIATLFHIDTASLVYDYGLVYGDTLTYSVDLKSEGARNLTIGWLQTDSEYNLSEFNRASDVVAAGSEGRLVINDISFDPSYDYLILAILNADYENTATKLFVTKVGESKTVASEAYKCLKLEKGSSATPWSMAPEDVNTRLNMAESSNSDTQDKAEENAAAINNAALQIDAINSIISTLITGENGETLMTQTDTGWTFSIANMQSALNSLTDAVSGLNTDSESAKSGIDQLNKSVNELGVYTDYIKFGVDNGKPCILLGETDSAFKVLITNTDIRFMEGSAVPASISNQKLIIETAVIKSELQHGDYSWVTSDDGHYSLMYKG